MSAVAWVIERIGAGARPRVRAFHVLLGLYVLAGAFSAAFAAHQRTAWVTVLLMAELAVLALLTSEFAADARRRQAIVLAVVVVTLYTAVLAVVALVLFYAGVHSALVSEYGYALTPSRVYTRVNAGFLSAPLMASWCVFASAMVAREDARLPRRLRLVTQVILGALVLLTFSRGIIAFFAAAGVRLAHRRLDSRAARRATVAVAAISLLVIAGLSVGRLHGDPAKPATARYEVPDPVNRWPAITTSFHTFKEHPLVGSGPGSMPGKRNHGRIPFRAHNTPLNVAATMGLPALVVLLGLFAVLWRERKRPTSLATWTGLGGLVLDGLAQDVDHFRHVWILLGMADAERAPPADG
jgi:hypothetical protein